MPLYEYNCQTCNNNIEIIQKFSDPPMTSCPTCGGTVTKIVSRTSFQLKGTGWYVSDYKKTKPESGVSTSAPSKKSGGDSGS